jgi:hypothetical protein
MWCRKQGTPRNPIVTASEKAEARKHIAHIAEAQRTARGSMEYVSVPRIRKLARRFVLVGVWVRELVGGIWRRLGDSHKFPGRTLWRLRLYRPSQTLSPWVFFWLLLISVCAVIAFVVKPKQASLGWIANWGLAGAVGALFATLWSNGIKSPYLARRIRRRVVEDPTALLRLTLAKKTTKVMELEPPLDTVPRNQLYDELLPGTLARTKDIQIIVGNPGAGKTTALLDLASILARIGFVPVLLQLRGECGDGDLFELAKRQFDTQVRPLVRTEGDTDLIWRWLCRRQRLVFLIDDLDQIGFDGEAGFQMRRLLEDLAPEGQPVIVTARPSGVPDGIAASAVAMEPLAFDTAVDIVVRPRKREPGATTDGRPSRRRIESWVRGGGLEEAPLYLEALAEMASVGVCPELPKDPREWEVAERPGRWRELSGEKREWNPLWVRYLLLQRFYDHILDGHVRRSLAIDLHDRKRCLCALEGAALGVLGATGLDAQAAAVHADEPEKTRKGQAKRRRLVDFIDSDDRQNLDPRTLGGRTVKRRREVSQHEAIDTGERLRILARDQHGEPQFRHRIMQAFFAGRHLAEIGRRESRARWRRDAVRGGRDGHVVSFDDWIETLMDHRHPERLTAHLVLTFAAIHADEQHVREHANGKRGGVGDLIADKLVKASRQPSKPSSGRQPLVLAEQLDPMAAPDPCDRRDPDDDLVKLTTAANIVALLRLRDDNGPSAALPSEIIERLEATEGAMRWTKQQALPAIAGLDSKESWGAVWSWFARDTDYEVRRSASRMLERNAWHAFSELGESIENTLLAAGRRAGDGLPLVEADGPEWTRDSIRALEALGWVLPAIVSGLNEEMSNGNGTDPDSRSIPADGAVDGKDDAEVSLRHARMRLTELVTLAFEGGRPKLEDALAQGFKADAMRHSSAATIGFKGPGWVASNRRLVSDVGLPHAESWYARMLLYQALALYAVAGTGRDDTLDMLAHRLHRTRERHPFSRQAARLARAGLRRAELGSERWRAFVWSDDVEGAGGLPAVLGHRAGQLVSDVTVLIDLKEGSPSERHEKFGPMEELPYCLSGSRDRHEILGGGCPERCGWGFCPYHAAAPDEPDQHRGISRGFCRAQRRGSRGRSPTWQSKIRGRRMREFWRQMEYKARR